jgi:hypothetical protein
MRGTVTRSKDGLQFLSYSAGFTEEYLQRAYEGRYQWVDTSPTPLIVHLWIYTALYCPSNRTEQKRMSRAERNVLAVDFETGLVS